MKKRFNFSRFVVIVTAAFVCFASANINAQTQTVNEKEQVEISSRQFWYAFARADFRTLKGNLGWPCILMQTNSSLTGKSLVYQSPEEFDKEIAATSPKIDEDSVFSGLMISEVKVELISDSVANVTYKCFIPEKQIRNPPQMHAPFRTRREQTLNFSTILRQEKSGWKIVFTCIPM